MTTAITVRTAHESADRSWLPDLGRTPERTGNVGAVLTGSEATILRWWQAALGALGWLVAAGLIAWFVSQSTPASVQVAATILTVAVSIALTSVMIAVQVLRPLLVRARNSPVLTPVASPDVDQLGRRLIDSANWSWLEGELVMTEGAAGRRPVPAGQWA